MINELVAQIEKKDAPIVVGLDPMLSYVPEYICKKAFSEYGDFEGCSRGNLGI